MDCMVLHAPGQPLRLEQRDPPIPAAGQVLIEVEACGVCRTDLHLVDGELPDARLPVVPGHQIVGRVVDGVPGLDCGQRVGVPWLGGVCGRCGFCRNGAENLCDEARFTGHDLDGGFSEYCVADPRFCFPLPGDRPAAELAPLLCAGLIGYRSLRLAGEGIRRLGIYGFGAAAHLTTPVAKHLGMTVYAFTRPGDIEGQRFALNIGCEWAGDSTQAPPQPLDAALIFAPVGPLVPQALRAVRKGGRVVCGGIHMSQIPAFAYQLLWGERQIRSVANLTRADAEAFLPLARQLGLRPTVRVYRLQDANTALGDLRGGRFEGAAVLVPGASQAVAEHRIQA